MTSNNDTRYNIDRYKATKKQPKNNLTKKTMKRHNENNLETQQYDTADYLLCRDTQVQKINKVARYEEKLLEIRRESRAKFAQIEASVGYDTAIELCELINTMRNEEQRFIEIKNIQDLTRYALELN